MTLKKVKKQDPTRCEARRKKDGAPCQIHPIKKSLSGRCRLHGGMSLKGTQSMRYKHGRYSKYAKQKVMEKIEKFRSDDDVRDLREELAILRGLLHSYLEHHTDILDDKRIDTLTKLTDKIEKTVSSLKVIEEGHTFTLKNVNNIILQLVKIVQLRVTDTRMKKAIAQDIKKLAYISV